MDVTATRRIDAPPERVARVMFDPRRTRGKFSWPVGNNLRRLAQSIVEGK